MKKAIKDHLRDFIAILLLVIAGVATTLVILVNQRADFPEWFPGLGKKAFEMKAEFSTAQAVTPGQGQSVDIAGVRVGEVTGVEEQDGTAVVTVEIEEQYSDLIHTDASVLLRPKTGLNDMVLALDPGTESAPNVSEGETLPLSQTEPNVKRTFHHRMSCLEEEIEAWHRGWKLAVRLGLSVTREEFDVVRLDCLKSYVRWTLQPETMEKD